MAEEEKKKKLIELIGEEVDKRLKDFLTTAIIPKGYTRCANCGGIIKLDTPCPYCESKEIVPEGEEGMLDLFLEREGEK